MQGSEGQDEAEGAGRVVGRAQEGGEAKGAGRVEGRHREVEAEGRVQRHTGYCSRVCRRSTKGG